jgi:hypothetical protein
VTPTELSQACNPNHYVPPFTITLKNGTSAAVAWTAEFETVNDTPWASAQPSSGTLAAGGSVTVTVTPNGQAFCGGLSGSTDFRLGIRQVTNSTVGGPLLGMVTDHISPP